MILSNLLSAADMETIRGALVSAQFSDGKQTATWYGRSVKENEQLIEDDPKVHRPSELIISRLFANKTFQSEVFPKGRPRLMFNRYLPGMHYGLHTDGPMAGAMRKDVSFTIFLTEPSAYEGGSLTLHLPYGKQSFKLDAGSAVVYPADTLHCVEMVTAGTRLAAVGWVQSQVRRFDQREILLDIDTARNEVFSQSGKTPEFDLLCKAYCNLIRMWGE